MTQRQHAIHIREMRPDDREFILSVAKRIASSGMPAWRDAEKMREFHRSYAEAAADAAGPDEAVFVAEDQAATPLGVVHAMETTDVLTGERQGYLATLAVVESAVGQGVGRALMDRAEEWCRQRGLRVAALDVFAQNHGARSFYARLGYLDETLKMIKEL
jgi:GNAT superfamily N-acetyltransferase